MSEVEHRCIVKACDSEGTEHEYLTVEMEPVMREALSFDWPSGRIPLFDVWVCPEHQGYLEGLRFTFDETPLIRGRA